MIVLRAIKQYPRREVTLSFIHSLYLGKYDFF